MAGPNTTGLSATQGSGTGIGFRNMGGGTYSQFVDAFPAPEFPFPGAVALSVGTSSVGTTSTAATFSISVAGTNTATHCYISVESSSSVGYGIRFWNTGDVPTAGTAGVGHHLASGAGPIEITNLGLLRMVTADTSAKGTVQLSQHSYPG